MVADRLCRCARAHHQSLRVLGGDRENRRDKLPAARSRAGDTGHNLEVKLGRSNNQRPATSPLIEPRLGLPWACTRMSPANDRRMRAAARAHWSHRVLHVRLTTTSRACPWPNSDSLPGGVHPLPSAPHARTSLAHEASPKRAASWPLTGARESPFIGCHLTRKPRSTIMPEKHRFMNSTTSTQRQHSIFDLRQQLAMAGNMFATRHPTTRSQRLITTGSCMDVIFACTITEQTHYGAVRLPTIQTSHRTRTHRVPSSPIPPHASSHLPSTAWVRSI
jgi:hypothetical protein